MLLVFRFFWFIVAAVMLINVAIWRQRLSQLVARGVLSPDESARLVRGAALWLATPCLVLGAIAFAAGWSDPFCAGMLSFADAPRAATSVIVLAVWAALLWWVWVGRGADLLARIGPALSNRPRYDHTYTTAQVRAYVTTTVLIAGVGAVVAAHVLSKQLPQGCAIALLAH